MPQTEDINLLRTFAVTRDEAAFTELVRRHIGLVYSTALRCAGNPHAAEEITQAVFILLARKAASLSPRAVLSGWLYQTARLTAANYLRAEIRRQKREQEAYMNSLSNESETEAWSRIAPLLEEAMARLNQADQHAIVLRYFENKPLEEVGAALGMSRDAARMRVNRALEKLRVIFTRRGVTLGVGLIAGAVSAHSVQAAPASLAIAISAAAVKASASTVGLGLGAKLASFLGKSGLLSWTVPLLALLMALPGMLFVGLMGRLERNNYNEADDFRSQFHRAFFRSFFWGYPLLVVTVLMVSSMAYALWGVGGRLSLASGIVIISVLLSARSLIISRNSFQIAMFAYCLIIAAGLLGQALAWIPPSLSRLSLVLATGLLLLVWSKRPLRMDYNLFLRAVQGLLQTSSGKEAVPSLHRLSPSLLLEFARFLGSRFLVANFRWESDGLALRLPPVKTKFLTNIALAFLPPITRGCSYIRLGWDGRVAARCGSSDQAALVELKKSEHGCVQKLESSVAETVAFAWHEFRSGKFQTAERILGHLPESEVFVVAPARAKSTRWWQYGIGIWMLLMLVLMGLAYWQPPWLEGLRPVAVTETQIRTFMNVDTTMPGAKYLWNRPADAVFHCLILPSTNLFDADGLQQMRDEVVGGDGFDAHRLRGWRPAGVFNTPLLRRALAGGWFSWSDLELLPEDFNFHPQLSWSYSPEHWDRFLTRCQAWSWFQGESFVALRMRDDGLTQLRLLRSVDCLDLVDQEKLIQHMAAVQVLSRTPPGQPPLHHWREVRGLFFTPCFPVLQDTYFSLAALEILGGLDHIDREQCIRGILRRHRGRGYFTSPESGGYNEYHIRGDARDTIAAFESLRILGALDRVKDLDQWQFRPERRGVPKEQLTWRDVEAWVCQQRLAKILQEHKANPAVPFRSLLEPLP